MSCTSFKEVLTECARDGAYRETCRRIVGDSSYGDPDDLRDLWTTLRTQPGRYLTDDDLKEIFARKKTHYGSYWTVPEHVRVDGKNVSLNESRLTEGKWNLVEELYPMLKSMEVTSVVLGCVHPRHFGVYSHPVLLLLQLPMKTPKNHYLAYCNELQAWASRFLPGGTVLESERALWVFYQEAFGHKSNPDKMKNYCECFDKDEWVRERHARNVLNVYFSSYLPLAQARFLLDIDANLSAKIVGCEFENRVEKLVDTDDTRRARKIKNFAFSMPRRPNPPGELEVAIAFVDANHLCSVSKKDLDDVRVLRNEAIHMKRDFNDEGERAKSSVKKMISVTGALPE